jgi:hypothetical protein
LATRIVLPLISIVRKLVSLDKSDFLWERRVAFLWGLCEFTPRGIRSGSTQAGGSIPRGDREELRNPRTSRLCRPDLRGREAAYDGQEPPPRVGVSWLPHVAPRVVDHPGGRIGFPLDQAKGRHARNGTYFDRVPGCVMGITVAGTGARPRGTSVMSSADAVAASTGSCVGGQPLSGGR